jgi:hypothetical protein
MGFRIIDAQIRYLTTTEGGRREAVGDGYRGQFHYLNDEANAWDGFQYFPDEVKEEGKVPLGKTIRARIHFPLKSWDKYHSSHVKAGMAFEIREGDKLVGRGIVTSVGANPRPTIGCPNDSGPIPLVEESPDFYSIIRWYWCQYCGELFAFLGEDSVASFRFDEESDAFILWKASGPASDVELTQKAVAKLSFVP